MSPRPEVMMKRPAARKQTLEVQHIRVVPRDGPICLSHGIGFWESLYQIMVHGVPCLSRIKYGEVFLSPWTNLVTIDWQLYSIGYCSMMPKSVILTVATWIVDEEPPHLAGLKKMTSNTQTRNFHQVDGCVIAWASLVDVDIGVICLMHFGGSTDPRFSTDALAPDGRLWQKKMWRWEPGNQDGRGCSSCYRLRDNKQRDS